MIEFFNENKEAIAAVFGSLLAGGGLIDLILWKIPNRIVPYLGLAGRFFLWLERRRAVGKK